MVPPGAVEAVLLVRVSLLADAIFMLSPSQEMVASLMNMKRESGEVPDESGDVDGVPLDQEEEDIG